jgi:hypothetical protein
VRADIFVSYASEDGDVARHVARGLKREGYAVWNYLDDGQIPGEDYVENIGEGVRAARVIVLFVSPNAVASPQCNAEAQIAWQESKVVIPLLSRVSYDQLLETRKGKGWVDRIGATVAIPIDAMEPEQVLETVLTGLRSTLRPSRAAAGSPSRHAAPSPAPAPPSAIAPAGGAILATIVGALGILYNLGFLKILFTPPATAQEHLVRAQFRLALTASILVNLAGLAQNGALLYGAGLMRKRDPRGAPIIRKTALSMLATIGLWALVNLMSFGGAAAARTMNSADLVQTTLATAAIALFPAAIVFWVFRKAKR